MSEWPNDRYEYTYHDADNEHGYLYAEDLSDATETVSRVLSELYDDYDEKELEIGQVND